MAERLKILIRFLYVKSIKINAKELGFAINFTPSNSNPFCLFNKFNCHLEILADSIRTTEMIYGKEEGEVLNFQTTDFSSMSH